MLWSSNLTFGLPSTGKYSKCPGTFGKTYTQMQFVMRADLLPNGSKFDFKRLMVLSNWWRISSSWSARSLFEAQIPSIDPESNTESQPLSQEMRANQLLYFHPMLVQHHQHRARKKLACATLALYIQRGDSFAQIGEAYSLFKAPIFGGAKATRAWDWAFTALGWRSEHS